MMYDGYDKKTTKMKRKTGYTYQLIVSISYAELASKIFFP